MDTKLHEAVRYGSVNDVRKALGQGYDPNLIGLYDWSPVHEAAHNGETKILSLLLKNKGDANVCDNLRGNTGLHYAAEEDHLDCLRLLLEVGGQPEICNSDNLTVFGVATGESRDFLEQFEMEPVNDPGKMKPGEGKDDLNNNMDTDEEEKEGRRRNLSTGVLRCESQEEFPAMGHLHLSFEYHIHKGSLKIRVWQISDLLLPPPHTSMINTIFVRSYLIPDKPKKTNRRTEEVKVAPSEAHVATNRSAENPGIQYVFMPSNFHFAMPLQYTGVTKEIINERSVQIEVCMTQRYTKRIFLVAMINMPLKLAVKKLIREKIPLIPCMNYTIPNNMKVYSASELQLESSLGVFYSSPMLQDFGKGDSLSVPQTPRSASDIELHGITIHEEKVPSTSINMHNGSHDFDFEPELDEVKVKRKIVPDFSSIDIPASDQVLPGQLEEVKVQGQKKNGKDCVVNVGSGDQSANSNHKLKRIKPPKFNGDMEIEMENVPKSVPSPVHLEEAVASPGPSRPETPVWDYYDFDDFELGMEPIANDVESNTENGSDAKMDYKGVNLSQSAVAAMQGKSTSKVKDVNQPRSYIPTIVVDDIENEEMIRL
ncbi:uncharacterized protein LOC124144983 [Haliotis rufescens]|uniref:uncharacterized protein LOC124144983 n=1 Tax=Haliotis rufescens TaxID=6454 RepID=UPI00201E9511|nr:uncharacterized protein LOC124144983 [Haliotis rufescens]